MGISMQERLTRSRKQNTAMENFMTQLAEKNESQSEGTIQQINVNDLHPYKNHKFRIRKNAAYYKALTNSIRDFGIQAPLIVRADIESPNGKYEIISGHTRCEIAKEIGLEQVPCIIQEDPIISENINEDISEDVKAAITDCLVIVNNLQREWQPSDKARNCVLFQNSLKKALGVRAGRRLKDEEYTPIGSARELTAEMFSEYLALKPSMLSVYEKIGKELSLSLQYLIDEEQIAVMAGYQLAFLPPVEQEIVEKFLAHNPKYVLKEGPAKELRRFMEEKRDSEELPSEAELAEVLGLTVKNKPKMLPKITITLPQEFDDKKIAASYRKHKNDPELLNRIAELTHEVIISYLEEHTK